MFGVKYSFKGFKKKSVSLDGQNYKVFIRKHINESPEVPRLVIAAYLPNKTAVDVLKCCIDSIKKYTDTPYELWVVDNNSPEKYIKLFYEDKDINIILNKTDPEGDKNQGSYRNAIQLELAAHFVSSDTKYFMTLQQDIAVCKKGWLKFLMSKFTDEVRGVGVRMEKTRVTDGCLHSLGAMFDFQLFRKLGLSYYPELPALDVADKISIAFKDNGYVIYATGNTLWDKHLVEEISENSIFKNFNVDRSLDDEGDVIFLHLGRSVLRAVGNFQGDKKLKNIETWIKFINEKLLGRK